MGELLALSQAQQTIPLKSIYPSIGGNGVTKGRLKHDISHNELQTVFSLGRIGTSSSGQNFCESTFPITHEKTLSLNQKPFL